MTDKKLREEAGKQVYRRIGDFLRAHHLFPTPENYALIYAFMTQPSSSAAQEIASLTSDGVRLSQKEADRIRLASGEQGSETPPADASEAIADARRYVEDFTSIVEAQRVQTTAYGADLARGAAALGELDDVHPAVAGVARITAAMLERTQVTQAQLDAAREETQALREKLAEVEEEARSDPLTRLPNRRAFEDRLAQMLGAGTLASVAICDIDRFKLVNDSHGHAVGDRVLRMVADVLRTRCEAHMVARIGGEEFVVLFDGVHPRAAGEILDGARVDLASRQFKVRGTEAPLGQITFSAGVARCVDAGESPLKRADALLYQAKNGGRNKVVVEEA